MPGGKGDHFRLAPRDGRSTPAPLQSPRAQRAKSGIRQGYSPLLTHGRELGANTGAWRYGFASGHPNCIERRPTAARMRED